MQHGGAGQAPQRHTMVTMAHALAPPMSGASLRAHIATRRIFYSPVRVRVKQFVVVRAPGVHQVHGEMGGLQSKSKRGKPERAELQCQCQCAKNEKAALVNPPPSPAPSRRVAADPASSPLIAPADICLLLPRVGMSQLEAWNVRRSHAWFRRNLAPLARRWAASCTRPRLLTRRVSPAKAIGSPG